MSQLETLLDYFEIKADREEIKRNKRLQFIQNKAILEEYRDILKDPCFDRHIDQYTKLIEGI